MDRDNKFAQQMNMLLKGYLIPIAGSIVIICVIIFIYIPNVTGIINGVQTLPQVNQSYDQYKNQIQYFKNLSTAQRQITLTDNLLAVYNVLPDDARTADSITQIQGLATQDGVSVTSITSTLFNNKAFQSSVTVDPALKVNQITFHGSGTSAQAEKLFSDITTMKQVASITDVKLNGQIGSGNDDVTFNCQIYTLSSSEIEKSLNMLQTMNTSYTTDYINTL